MAVLLTMLDRAAYARGGHGYSSCHYNCGWNVLTGISLFLVGMLYQLAKYALTENRSMKDFLVSALLLLVCAGVAVGALLSVRC